MKKMFNALKNNLCALPMYMLLIMLYAVLESTSMRWLYATAPVAIVTAAVAVISFIAGTITKKYWLTLVFPNFALLTITALAVVSKAI